MLSFSARSMAGFGVLTVLGTTTLSTAGGLPGDGPENCLPLVIGTQTGTTVGFTDDSDEACPYGGSTSPDVYYCFTPASDIDLTLELCESGYDTKIYVYDANLELLPTAPCEPACNDDACSSSGGGGFRSRLRCIPFVGGETYYVVVDGWSGAAGPYTLVAEPADGIDCLHVDPCWAFFACPPGITLEEDEACAFGTQDPNDVLNGGCDCDDPAGCFQSIECGEVICGTSYFDGTFGDTDWYALDISAYGAAALEISGSSEFCSVVGRVENGGGALTCADTPGLAELVTTEACLEIALTTSTVVGTELWIYVASDFSKLIDCQGSFPSTCAGPDYFLTVTCVIPPCPFDLDGSGGVDIVDLVFMLSAWGPCSGACDADFDASGDVGFGDLVLLLANWGECPRP